LGRLRPGPCGDISDAHGVAHKNQPSVSGLDFVKAAPKVHSVVIDRNAVWISNSHLTRNLTETRRILRMAQKAAKLLTHRKVFTFSSLLFFIEITINVRSRNGIQSQRGGTKHKGRDGWSIGGGRW